MKRGRQAEARRNDLLVLDAAREVFAIHGPDAPIGAVAERAGVGIGTLYRRYGGKADLLRRLCLLAMEQTIGAAEAALAAEDAWQGLAGYVTACVGFRSGALGALAGTVETTPELWETSRRGRALLEEVVGRARRDGGVRPDVTALDVAWLVELFSRHGVDDERARRRLLAIALDGLRAGDAPPLPEPAPSAADYEERWRYPGSAQAHDR